VARPDLHRAGDREQPDRIVVFEVHFSLSQQHARVEVSASREPQARE